MSPAHRTIGAAASLLFAALLTGCSVEVRNAKPSTPNPRNTESAPPAPPRREPKAAGTPPPAIAEEETDEQAWKAIETVFGIPGELKDGVYRVVFPRDDLEVSVEGNAVPPAAGVASEFRFYRCPCGRINVMGQFVVADYEANDVIDALRGGDIEVASVGPLLLHERPRLLLIRFFGENKSGGALSKTLRTALAWTGKERMAPQKLPE